MGRELDSFVETDDIVRRNLDRKEKVYQIRSTIDTQAMGTGAIVHRSRSPMHGGSPFREEIVEVVHEQRSRSPYAGVVHPYPPHHEKFAVHNSFQGPPQHIVRRDFSPARKENMAQGYPQYVADRQRSPLR